MPRQRRANLFLDMDVDKQLEISYPKGPMDRDSSPYYIGPTTNQQSKHTNTKKNGGLITGQDSSLKRVGKTITVSEDVLYLLKAEKIRLMRKGCSITCYGDIIMYHLTQSLNGDKETYERYLKLGFIKKTQ